MSVDDELSPGEVARWLERLTRAVDGLTSTLPTTYVPANLWAQRNQQVDERHRDLGRELGDLRTELRSRRLPWPSVVAVLVAAAALGLSLMDRIYG